MPRKTRNDVNLTVGAEDKTAEAFKSVQRNLQNMASSTAILDGPLSAVAGRFSALSAALGRVNPSMIAWGTAVAASVLVIKNSLEAFAEYEKVMFRIDSQLRATGNAAGVTAGEINRLAVTLGEETLASAQGVREAASELLAFRKISGEMFEEAIRLAQDYTAVFGGNLQSNIIKVARALDDPRTGLEGLREKLGALPAVWRENVIAMNEAGDELKSQTAIIDELRARIGGSGAAEAAGLSGSIDTLNERWGRFKELLSESSTGSTAVGFVNLLSRAVGALNRSLTSDRELKYMEDRQKWVSILANLQEKYNEVSADSNLTDTEKAKILKSMSENMALYKKEIQAVDEAYDPAIKFSRLQAEQLRNERIETQKNEAALKEYKEGMEEYNKQLYLNWEAEQRFKEQGGREFESVRQAALPEDDKLRDLYERRVTFLRENGAKLGKTEEEINVVLLQLTERYVEDYLKLHTEKNDKNEELLRQNVEKVQESLLDEIGLIEKSYTDKAAIIAADVSNEILTEKEKYQVLLALAEEYHMNVNRLREDNFRKWMDVSQAMLQNINTVFSTYSDLQVQQVRRTGERQEEELNSQFDERLIALNEKRAQDLVTEEEYNNEKKRINTDRYRALDALDKNISGQMDARAKKSFEVSKQLSKVTAIIKGIEAAQSAYASGMTLGGPILATAFAATAVAAAAANVAAIDAQTFNPSTGISVPPVPGSTFVEQRNDDEKSEDPSRGIQIIFNGPVNGSENIKSLIVDAVREATDNDVIVISSSSAQAQHIRG